MPTLEELRQSLKPDTKQSVHSLLGELGYDLRDWKNVKGGLKPSQNPKFCYNWSFEQPKKSIALCIWFDSITDDGRTLLLASNLRREPINNNPIRVATWKRRAKAVDKHLQLAYLNRLPVHAIIIHGEQRDRTNPESESSSPDARLLDDVNWAVTEYDFPSGDYVLKRGAKPIVPFTEDVDPEASGFAEGTPRRAYRSHRHREWRARKAKIDAVLGTTGKLVCEVPNCGFDFSERYGTLGDGYAHVHHTIPLHTAPAAGTTTRLEDLAIVCPNCHAMIHLGGECRPLEGLIPAR